MPRVSASVEVDRPEDLLALYYPNGKQGGLAVPGAAPATAGQKARLTVRVKAPAREFQVVVTVAWARLRGSKALQPAWGADFSPDADPARDRLLQFARKQVQAEALRLEPRVQVSLPVRLVHAGLENKEQLADLSTGGAFIRTRRVLDPGAKVELVVRPPLSLTSLTLAGRVVWVRAGGPDAGMGVAFVDGEAARPKLKKLLAKVAPAVKS